MDAEQAYVTLSVSGADQRIAITENATAATLFDAINTLDASTVKLLHKGKRLTRDDPLTPGMRVLCLGTTTRQKQAIAAQRSDPTIRGFKAEAQREAARTRLDNHRIQAPFAGVIGLSDISLGTYLGAGTSVATLDSTTKMELGFAIPERFLGQIHIGQTVRGTSPAYTGETFGGELVELGTRIDELSRTLPVRALIDNPDGKLRPGQFMSATLTLRERESLVIPEQAVMIRGDEKYVFVAEDGIARRVSVTLGSRMPGLVEIVDGLSLDEQVIVTGQDRLSSGDRISVVEGENVIPDNRFANSLES